MPCRDDWGNENEIRIIREQGDARKKLEELLCSSSRVLERLGYDFSENPELDKWWHRHKKEDDARIQREAREAEQKEKERIGREILMARAKAIGDKPFSSWTAAEKQLMKRAGLI